MRNLEEIYHIGNYYEINSSKANQHLVTEYQRAKSIQLLYNIYELRDYKPSTFFSAVQIFDRFI